MKEKLENMQDNSYKNMQNPDFLWEIPNNAAERYSVRQMQEVGESTNDSNDNTNNEKRPKKER